MKKNHVHIRTAGGRLAWCGYIYPMTVCGSRHYNSSLELASEEGCLATDPMHQPTGGRNQSVIDVPAGFELVQLTSPQCKSIDYLGGDYITPDTVHSEWKCRLNQGVALIERNALHVEQCVSWEGKQLYGLFVFCGQECLSPQKWIDRRRPFPYPLVKRLELLVRWIYNNYNYQEYIEQYLLFLSDNMGLLDKREDGFDFDKQCFIRWQEERETLKAFFMASGELPVFML